MKKFLKWCLYIGVFVLFLIVSAIGLAVYYQDEVKAKFVEQLNNHIDTQISVDGPIALSFIKSFPQASVSFPNISIRESLPNSSENFLEAEELLLVFNITDLLKGNYTVKKLKLRNGFANIVTTQSNAVNYHFWKTQESVSDSSQFELKINDAELSQFSIVYDNRVKKHFHSGTINHARIQGRFDKSNYALSCRGDLFLEVIQTGKQTFIEEQQSNVSLAVQIDKENSSYSFENSTISILGDEFMLNGIVIDEQVSTNLDLQIQGKDLNMASIISLLPPNYRKELKGFRSEGQAFIDIDIQGRSSMELTPAVQANFGITNGTIYHPNIERSLSKVNTTGTYQNAVEQEPSHLTLNKTTGEINKRGFEGSMRMTNLDEPTLHLNLSASLELKEFQTILASNQIKKPTGLVHLNNFEFHGDMRPQNLAQQLRNIKSSGQITLEHVAFEYHGQPIHKFNGTLDFNNRNLTTNNFEIAFPENDFSISGTLNGLFESIATRNEGRDGSVLELVNGQIHSNQININALQKLTGAKESVDPDPNNTPYFDVTNYLRGNVSIQVDNFKWNDIQAKSIDGALRLKKNKIEFTKTKAQLFSGDAILNGALIFNPTELVLQSTAQCSQMNIKQLFKECHNFGQDEITHQEIDGVLDATIDFTTVWNNLGDVVRDKIEMTSDISIHEGELKNYSSLEALSDYVQLEDLKHVRFSELKNRIQIKDRVVHIPSMRIESSAMDIDIQGSHSFDHDIDYFFKINLLEVLATKFKKRNSEFDDIETKPQGNIDFYVSLIGTVQDYDISFQKSKNKQAQLGPTRKKTLGTFIKEEIKGKPKSTNQDPKRHENEELEFIDWE